MATTYDLNDFHLGVLPGGLEKEAIGCIQGGLAVGWTVSVKGMTARLISPNKNKTLMFSASARNLPYEQYRRIITRHANPLLMESLTSDEGMHNMVDDLIEREQQNATKAAQVKPEPAFISADEDLVLPDDDDLEQPEVSARKLVSQQPMIARRRQGKGYPSETTDERTWSDGTVDFACRFEGCEFSSAMRNGVGAHWRTHVHAGDVERLKQPNGNIDIPEYEVAHREGYTPRRERVGALAEVLAALDLTKMSSEDIAEFVLNWQHEQSASGSRLAAEREDLTSDDILNRIRNLLDNGTYLRQRDEIAALRDEMGRRRDSEAEALTRAQNAEDKWTALRELMDA